MDGFEDIKIIALEVVKAGVMLLEVTAEFFEAFHHELDAVVREVRVLFWLDLLWSEDEYGSDRFPLDYLGY